MHDFKITCPIAKKVDTKKKKRYEWIVTILAVVGLLQCVMGLIGLFEALF